MTKQPSPVGPPRDRSLTDTYAHARGCLKSAAASILLTLVAASPAKADCLSDRGAACINVEQSKSNATRGGVSASEFCAISAVAQCDPGLPRRGAVQAPPGGNYERKFDFGTGGALEEQKGNSDDRHLSTFSVRGGLIKISTGSRQGETPQKKPYIKYNDELIEEFSDKILSIESFISVADYGVIIYSTTYGGSGSSEEYSLISVDGRGRPYRSTIPTGYGNFEYTVRRNMIVFDLGINDGRIVQAIFADGQLKIFKKPISRGYLGDDDCLMLYGILDECARSEQDSCSYVNTTLSMASQRPINSLAHNNPNYRDGEFKLSCEQTCRSKRKPALASFKKAVCRSG